MGLHRRTKAMVDDRGSDADKKKLARLEAADRALSILALRTGLVLFGARTSGPLTRIPMRA